MTNDLNSLRADKKKVDDRIERLTQLVEIVRGKAQAQTYREIALLKTESQSLAKGISVATKLIEDDKLVFEKLRLKISPDASEEDFEDASDIIEDRIKYLRGLLVENSKQ